MTATPYQTRRRMAAKWAAIGAALPASLAGLRVLDIGCNAGWWCHKAVELGAAEVIGVDRESPSVWGAVPMGWTYRQTEINPNSFAFGEYDVVFCFAVYHHLFGRTGDHGTVWRWLRAHLPVGPGGLLLWEGPTSTSDSVARDRAAKHTAPYTREAILEAARTSFDVDVIGPAIYRPHREVFRCRAT